MAVIWQTITSGFQTGAPLPCDAGGDTRAGADPPALAPDSPRPRAKTIRTTGRPCDASRARVRAPRHTLWIRVAASACKMRAVERKGVGREIAWGTWGAWGALGAHRTAKQQRSIPN